MDNKAAEWDKSYARYENHILEPQTNVVKFLNRYLGKRTVDGSTSPSPPPVDTCTQVKVLDFACGIGAHAVYAAGFGVRATGLDISQNALDFAKKNAAMRGVPATLINFEKISGPDCLKRFREQGFSLAIAESCLDSMPFALARSYLSEILLCTRGYVHLTLISDAMNNGKCGEVVIESGHENGTIQYFYSEKCVEKLLDGMPMSVVEMTLSEERTVSGKDVVYSRYYITLSNCGDV